MGDEGHIAGGWAGRRQESGVDGQMRIEQANAVGADQPDAVLPGDFEYFIFKFFTLGANLAESARTDDGSLNAALPALAQGIGHVGRRDQHRGKINRVGDFQHVGVDCASQ